MRRSPRRRSRTPAKAAPPKKPPPTMMDEVQENLPLIAGGVGCSRSSAVAPISSHDDERNGLRRRRTAP
jgi:hypothetical protein